MISRFKKNPLFVPSSQAPARNFIITVFISCYAVTVLPIGYFLYKNYLVLDEIGFKFFPTLLDINNNDKILVISFFIISFFVGLAIQVYAQKYFLKKIYGPIDLVQAHLSQLILGDFNQPKVPLKQDQYVHELVKSYNYFYGSLQTNLKRDITFLKALEEKHDPELAKVLKNEKLNQLNILEDDSVSKKSQKAESIKTSVA
jgi:hypothetical protein